MPRTTTIKWDVAALLDSPAARAEYVRAAFDDGDPALIAAALGDVARAMGMSRVADSSGLSRESLYKSLALGGNPALETVLRVMSAVGLELRAVPARRAARRTGRLAE